MRSGRRLSPAGRGLLVVLVTLMGSVRPAGAAGICSITTVSHVAFGTYDVFNGSPLDSTGIVRINCNGGAKKVIVDLGRGNAPTYLPRYMLNGANRLDYNLFLDAARTVVWGDATGGTSHYGPVDPPNKTNVDLTIFGRVPAGQDLPAGAYADTITATVNF